jgi:hypothetical protein
MIDYIRGDIYKIVAASPEDYGDFNQDGTVDDADYVVWRKGFGTTYDETDYNNWVKFFGGSIGAGGGSGGLSMVPEPHAFMLLSLAALSMAPVRSLSQRHRAKPLGV